MSDIGFGALPMIVNKKQFRRGFDFTILVVGESGLGKSTLINTLFLIDLYQDRVILSASERIKQTVALDTFTVDIEEKGVKLRLTIVDTPGFGDAVNSTNCWEPIIQYINEQYSNYLRDENGLNRKNIIDNRVHACLYFLNPSSHGLKPIDIEVMSKLHHLVNIIPLIAKADTLTASELQSKKNRMLREIRENNISIYTGYIEDEEDNEEIQKIISAIPLGVVGSQTIFEVSGKRVRGRHYPWGIVEVEDPVHSDFPLLRNMLIRTHMQDLKDMTQETHYENYRKACLLNETPISTKIGNQLDMSKMVTQAIGVSKVRDKLIEAKDKELEDIKRQMAILQAQLSAQQIKSEDTRV